MIAELEKAEHSLAILPSKKARKEDARLGGAGWLGTAIVGLRERRVLRVDQRRVELFLCLDMSDRKYVRLEEVIS